MECGARWRQLDLLVHGEVDQPGSQRLAALDRAELTRLLKLLLIECVTSTAKSIEAGNEQDHT
jgi:hypothetical protein